MAKGEAVDVGVRIVLRAAVVEETPNLLDSTCCVDDKNQTIEFAYGVNAAWAYSLFTVLDVP